MCCCVEQFAMCLSIHRLYLTCAVAEWNNLPCLYSFTGCIWLVLFLCGKVCFVSIPSQAVSNLWCFTMEQFAISIHLQAVSDLRCCCVEQFARSLPIHRLYLTCAVAVWNNLPGLYSSTGCIWLALLLCGTICQVSIHPQTVSDLRCCCVKQFALSLSIHRLCLTCDIAPWNNYHDLVRTLVVPKLWCCIVKQFAMSLSIHRLCLTCQGAVWNNYHVF